MQKQVPYLLSAFGIDEPPANVRANIKKVLFVCTDAPLCPFLLSVSVLSLSRARAHALLLVRSLARSSSPSDTPCNKRAYTHTHTHTHTQSLIAPRPRCSPPPPSSPSHSLPLFHSHSNFQLHCFSLAPRSLFLPHFSHSLLLALLQSKKGVRQQQVNSPISLVSANAQACWSCRQTNDNSGAGARSGGALQRKAAARPLDRTIDLRSSNECSVIKNIS